jgi:hypothetical protein
MKSKHGPYSKADYADGVATRRRNATNLSEQQLRRRFKELRLCFADSQRKGKNHGGPLKPYRDALRQVNFARVHALLFDLSKELSTRGEFKY